MPLLIATNLEKNLILRKREKSSGADMKSLVVVESPAKAKTINKFLGKSFIVKASVGHVKDLPKNELGVDVDKDFRPKYVTIQGKGKILKEIKKIAKETENIYLAQDPDREGEAIAWHIAEELDGDSDKIYRVLFNEITSKAVLEAIENPKRIDHNKVEAQQARRIMDRLVGYMISPILWKKVKRGLSAGRVQSVAVRIVVDRERERKGFIPQEFWSLTAHLKGKKPPAFDAKLREEEGKKVELKNRAEADRVLKALEGEAFIVKAIDRKDKKRYPVPPFTTSKLQQEAVRKLRFPAKKTMLIAQQLYEGLDIGPEGAVGLITYMRTDSVRISKEAQDEARDFIIKNFGSSYLPSKPPIYKSQRGAQEAHEAIRPTSVLRHPDKIKDYLTKDQLSLYRLIWNRFVASQMNPSILDQLTVDIKAGRFLFRATGSTLKFPGFTALYTEGRDEEVQEEEKPLPELKAGEVLSLIKLDPKQHFTQPPPRYTEATLVKELEEKGIGRPSTYATILSTIQEREYVKKSDGKFQPTELGLLVNDLLVDNFPDLFDLRFTARMEEELDRIEDGGLRWVQGLRDFYGPFQTDIEKAKKTMKDVKAKGIPTDFFCEKCGKRMVIKWGRSGRFLACSGYPECKNTTPIESHESRVRGQESEERCEKCGSPMVVKTSKYGKFLACSRYPECKTTKPLSTGVSCPEKGCGGIIIERKTKKGKTFFSCSNYPKCNFALWDRPIPQKCPKCGASFLIEKKGKLLCIKKGCGYKEEKAASLVEV
jgi:DNA topoisomerase-1